MDVSIVLIVLSLLIEDTAGLFNSSRCSTAFIQARDSISLDETKDGHQLHKIFQICQCVRFADSIRAFNARSCTHQQIIKGISLP